MSRRVVVGEIVGAYGVLGWVKIKSFTDPAANILGYGPWIIEPGNESRTIRVIHGRTQGVLVVASLEGVENRDQARALKGVQIAVPRACFPKPSHGKFYWADLVGLEVLTTMGHPLGKINGLLETGANDVLEVKGVRDRLIPFVMGEFVKEVNLDEGRLVVDWDPDF
jgi:16S rRNA processing protein RimM